MARHVAGLKLKRFATELMLVVVAIAGNVSAGDATTTNSNPAVATNIKTPNSACTNNTEEAVSATGKIIKCQGGVWTYQGVTDIERVYLSVKIQASDIGTYKSLVANCPAGKRVLDGGCALLSGVTYDDGQNLYMDTASSDLRSWHCGYGPLNSNATKQWNFFGWNDAEIRAETYCGAY